MRITFIYPKFEKLLESRLEIKSSEGAKKHLGDFSMPPALGIPIMTAMSKAEHSIQLYDENIEPINYDDDADLIAVSFFTPQANFAYEVAKRFKAKGKTVIGGGMHPSLMPEEAVQYFDAICIGEVEGVWNEMIDDFQNKGIYLNGEPLVTMAGGGASWKNELDSIEETKRALKQYDFWNFDAGKNYILRILRTKLKIFLSKIGLNGIIKKWRRRKWEN